MLKSRDLFRGKCRHSGEWIEGFLFEKHEDCATALCISKEPLSANDYSEILGDWCEVIPETICRCTGVPDRNDKMIFENDIVIVYARGYHTKCSVGWAETVAHYQLWQANTVPGTPTALNLGNYDCEVIGNIIDNPELLGVKR